MENRHAKNENYGDAMNNIINLFGAYVLELKQGFMHHNRVETICEFQNFTIGIYARTSLTLIDLPQNRIPVFVHGLKI